MKHISKLLLLFFSVTRLSAQNYGDAVLPKQDLETSNSAMPGMDLSTGTICQSIPLVSLKGRSTAVPVDLIYTGARGLKPTDVATRVGWGWDIRAGGKVTREVRGIRDEKKYQVNTFTTDELNQSGWLDDHQFMIFNNGSAPRPTTAEMIDLYKNTTAPVAVPQIAWPGLQHGYFFNSWTNNQYAFVQFDTEPDVFSFEFGSYSGQFVFDKTGKPVLIPYQDIKILPGIGPHATSTDWTFITPDGFSYVFSQSEVTSIGHSYIPNGSADTYEFISTWFLSKIIDPIGSEINFSYNSNSLDFHYSYKSTFQPEFISGSRIDIYKDCQNNICEFPMDESQMNIRIRGKKELTRITSEFGTINFISGGSYRMDMDYEVIHQVTYGFHPLSRVELLNPDGILINAFVFSQSYFGTPPQHGTNPYWHLKLDAISQIPSDGSDPLVHTFEYEPFVTVAAGDRHWFIDKWGYFNNDHSFTPHSNSCDLFEPGCNLATPNSLILREAGRSDGSDRLSNLQYTSEGVLNRITFPTGGCINYEYELHTYYDPVSSVNKDWGGLRIKRIVEKPNGPSAPEEFVKEIHYNQELTPANSSGQVIPLRRQYDFTDYNTSAGSLQGRYLLRYASSNRDNARDFIRYSHVEVVEPGKGKITFDFTSYSTHPDLQAIRFNFNHSLASPWTQYYGDKDNDAGAPYIDQSRYRGLLLKKTVFMERPPFGAYTSDQLKIAETTFQYQFSFPGFTPEIVQASRVNCEQKLYQTGSNSSSVQSFNIEYYTHNSNWFYLKSVSNRSFSQDGFVYNPVLYQDNIIYYDYNSQHPSQTKSVKVINSDNRVITTNYVYASDVNDNMVYPTGSDDSWAIRQLNQNNVINLPLEIIVRDETDPVHPYTLNSTFVKYKDFGVSAWGKNMILPREIYLTHFANPSAIFNQIKFQNIGNFMYMIKDGNYESDFTFDAYDKYGHVITEYKKGGSVKSHLWGYRNSILSVADFISNKNENRPTLSGSPYINIGNECSYLGFESLTQPEEGDYWAYAEQMSASSVIATDAHTGYKCQQILEAGVRIPHVDPVPEPIPNGGIESTVGPFTYSAGRAFIPDYQNGTYKFGAWIKTSSNFTDGEASLVVSLHHRDGTSIVDGSQVNVGYFYTPIPNVQTWTYASVVINLEEFRNENSSYLISPNEELTLLCYLVNYDETNYNYILIDDIRFNSIEAHGSSYTYKTVDLKSSESDVNSKPTFFTYDGFNRPKAVINFKNEVISFSEFFNNNSYTINSPHFSTRVTPQVSISISDYLSNNFSSADVITSTDYLDGYNRPIQSLIKDYFNDGSSDYDLITTIAYDAFNRQAIKYQPYALSNGGSFDQNSLSNQNSFYSNADKVAHDSRPFEEKVFENSPVNFIRELSLAGTKWDVATSHTEKYSYTFNTGNEVKLWKILRNANGSYRGANTVSYYPENTLLKIKHIDNDGNVQYIFKDKRGKIVYKKFEIYTDNSDKTFDFTQGRQTRTGGSTKMYGIYYIYDEFNQIVYTLPIQWENNSLTSFTDDQNLTDSYFRGLVDAKHYDGHGRIIHKHVPDGDWENYTYDSEDRPCLFQNRTLKQTNEWYVIKYDPVGRVAVSGIVTLTGYSQKMIQDNLNSNAKIFIRSTIQNSEGYLINSTFPTAINNIHIINYYDHYAITDPTLSARDYQTLHADDESSYSVFVTGKLVAQKKLILQSSDYLNFKYYYNDKANLIESQNQTYIDYPNGWDVTNNQYLFNGNVKLSTRKHSALGVDTYIQTRYTYDRIGRRISTFKQVNSEHEVEISSLTYNSLGQVVRKILHNQPVWGNQFLQGIDYRYNINGWMTSINNATLANDGDINLDDFDVFGEQLSYESPTISNSQFSPIASYSGKISQSIWRTKPAPGPVDYDIRPIHSYTYRYDELGRLTAAYYAANSSANPIDFFTNINFYKEKETYDIRGNITFLERNSEKGMPIDYLTMLYRTNSNQLLSVEDFPNGNKEVNDFHNNATLSTEYKYDYNGNLLRDDNKSIDIAYNFLNLAESITGTNSLNNVYDASGNKLQTTVDGIARNFENGIEYEQSTLQMMQQEEGRIRKSASGTYFSYDYFIKDHLGNIRVVLTTEDSDADYYATMEPANSSVEDQVFYNITSTRQNKLPGYPVDASYTPDVKASALSTSLGKTIGHAKVLVVSGDDVVHLDTKYFYSNTTPENSTYRPLNDILNELAVAFLLNPSNGLSVAGSELSSKQDWANKTFLANPELNGFLTTTLDQNSLNNPGKPKAFLAWLFFTEKEFKFVPDASGILPVTESGQLGELGVLDLKLPANGYLYVYVSNESARTVDFDHLAIHHKTGKFLEENHYYPYGMLIEGLSYKRGWMVNNYKFNGDHYETNSELFNYITKYRSYDPVIAKWNQLDPVSEFANGYFGFAGNPVTYSDPIGLKATYQGNGGGDSPSAPSRDPFDTRNIGAGGGQSASGDSYNFGDQICSAIMSSIEDGTYGTSEGSQWNINHMLMEGGGSSGFIDDPYSVTSINNSNGDITFSTNGVVIAGNFSITYLGSDNCPQMRTDYATGIQFYASNHYWLIPGESTSHNENWHNALTFANAFEITTRTTYGMIELSQKIAYGKVAVELGGKSIASKLPLVGAFISTGEGLTDGWKNSNTADVVIGIGMTALETTLIALEVTSPVGWILGAVSFAADLYCESKYGESWTQHVFNH